MEMGIYQVELGNRTNSAVAAAAEDKCPRERWK